MTAEVSKLAGVVKVTADVAAGSVTVECSQPLDHAEVATAIDAAGYELAS